MNGGRDRCRSKRYVHDEHRIQAAGAILIALGLLLLFACIPGWLWLAVFGVLLMAAGWLLLKWNDAWR